MTTEHHASRTLVKSPPELWAECSDAASLARHIGEFGGIRITRLDPETAVAWEGELATGTVEIEPAGWGTRVTLIVQTAGGAVSQAADGRVLGQGAGDEPAEPQIAETESVEEEVDETVEATPAQPDPALEADPDPAGGRWKRLITRTRAWFKPRAGEPGPATVSASAPPPEPGEAAQPEASIPPPEPGMLAPALEEPEPDPAGEPDPSFDPDAILTAALDSLGQAHHRPFSRA